MGRLQETKPQYSSKRSKNINVCTVVVILYNLSACLGQRSNDERQSALSLLLSPPDLNATCQHLDSDLNIWLHFLIHTPFITPGRLCLCIDLLQPSWQELDQKRPWEEESHIMESSPSSLFQMGKEKTKSADLHLLLKIKRWQAAVLTYHSVSQNHFYKVL